MSSLPTAYANQRFGRKCLDFYAAAGDVIGADPRARADERRLQDLEGARHTVRLMETGFQLDPGEQASVLRMQPGPARRSRPVAVVNHTTGAWARTHPGAAGLLARAGVARSMNWALTMALFALAALAVVWPYLRAFLIEIDPAVFERAPQFDVFALAAAAAPPLAEWRLADLIAGFAARIDGIAPGFEAYAAPAAFGAAVLTAAVMVHALRSWRLVWAPVFVAGLGVAALGFNGVDGAVAPALSGLGAAATVFVMFGLINHLRDAARLERRIAVLSDHILRNPPEEMVAGGADETVEAEQEETRESAEESGDQAPSEAPEAAAYRSGDPDAPSAPAGPSETQTPEAGAETGPDPDGASDTTQTETDGPVEDAHADAASRVETPEGGDAPGDSPDETPDAMHGEADHEAAGEAEAPGARADGDADRPDRSEAEPAQAGAGEGADMPLEGEDGAEAANTFEQEESERLRTDPRYASRAIVLPPPPPMPAADEAGDGHDDQGGGEASGAATSASGTRTLNPGAPLPSNVVPMFAPPAPSRSEDEPVD